MRTPGIVAGVAPSDFMVVALWAIGGLIILVSAFATVELGASIPHAGGPYASVRCAFGLIAGSFIGIGDWFGLVLSLSYLSIVFAEYLHRAGAATSLPLQAMAMLLIATVTATNWTSTRSSGHSQIVATA